MIPARTECSLEFRGHIARNYETKSDTITGDGLTGERRPVALRQNPS